MCLENKAGLARTPNSHTARCRPVAMPSLSGGRSAAFCRRQVHSGQMGGHCAALVDSRCPTAHSHTVGKEFEGTLL